MENAVKLSILLEIYGKLLTEKQCDLLDDYYNSDLSLSEIAENQGITRQAVRDNLKKGEKNLLEYEDKLGIMKKNEVQQKMLDDIFETLNSISNESNKDVKVKIEKVKQKLKNF